MSTRHYFSAQGTEYTGIAESELLGWRWMDVLHPDDREPTRQFWTDSVVGRCPHDVEYRVRGQDGAYGLVQDARGLPIRDSEGKIVKWFGTCTDITDRKPAIGTCKRLDLAFVVLESHLLPAYCSPPEARDSIPYPT